MENRNLPAPVGPEHQPESPVRFFLVCFGIPIGLLILICIVMNAIY